MRPNFRMTVSVTFRPPSVSDISKGSTRTVSSRTGVREDATRSSSSDLLDESTREAPSARHARAKASPIPDDAPVIQTTLPSSLPIWSKIKNKTDALLHRDHRFASPAFFRLFRYMVRDRTAMAAAWITMMSLSLPLSALEPSKSLPLRPALPCNACCR